MERFKEDMEVWEDTGSYQTWEYSPLVCIGSWLRVYAVNTIEKYIFSKGI